MKPSLRAAALILLLGCSSTSEPRSGDVALDLRHGDPRFRAQAARQAVEENRVDLAPELIRALADDNPAVRMWASIALRKLTGQDLEFKPHGTETEREAAIRRWEEWLGASSGLQAARRSDG